MKIRNVAFIFAAVFLMACPTPTPDTPVDTLPVDTIVVPDTTPTTPEPSLVVVTVSVDDYVVSGTTTPNTAVLIISPSVTEIFPEATTTSDASGNFSARLKVAGQYKVCLASNKVANCNSELITVPLN